MKKIIILLFISLFIFSCSEQEEEIVKVEKVDTTPKTILALGDSLTAGYGVGETENYPYKLGKKLEENGYKYDIINAGVSGDTSANLKSRASLYLEKNPDIVILVIGGNDGLRGLPVEDMKQNILDIIAMYEKDGVKIVLGGMDIPANLGLSYKSSFKNVYKEIADEKDKIYFYEYFLEGVAGDRMLNNDDLIHPNGGGYDIIVGKLFTFLEENKLINK
ncbi:arylesterase [Candidatus Gracilibacteria bacterium]|nr:arylesterase [Candidatus Gracilibacteria bacterium]